MVHEFDRLAEDVTPEQVRETVLVGGPRPAQSNGSRSSPSWASTRSTSTTSARISLPFIDAFGEHVLPGLAKA